MFSKDQISLLRQFVDSLKNKPDLLHSPEISFFKDYIESFGGRVPPGSASSASSGTAHESADREPPSPEEPDEIIEESDVELDNTGVIGADSDAPLPMGDLNKEVTDEMCDKSDEMRTEALSAASEGNYEKALKLITEAIELNPGSALLHAKRASILLQLNKPIAAIRDCDKAISINPDSAQAYKFRGRANRLLGNWETAHTDLATACKLDYDDQANAWLKEVEPNFKKLYEHKRKMARKLEEREEKKRADRRKKAQEAYEKAKHERSTGCCDEDEACGGPGGMGGMGGMADLFGDPEIMAALQDPDVMTAFSDVTQNPMNMAKYQNNPKVKKVLEKLASKFGGAGGGFPGASFKPQSTSGPDAETPKAKVDLDVD